MRYSAFSNWSGPKPGRLRAPHECAVSLPAHYQSQSVTRQGFHRRSQEFPSLTGLWIRGNHLLDDLVSLLSGRWHDIEWPGSATKSANSHERGISNDAGRVKSFFFCLILNSSTHLRRRTNCVSLAASVHLYHPNLLSPFTIINSVLPTKHLFDHHRP